MKVPGAPLALFLVLAFASSNAALAQRFSNSFEDQADPNHENAKSEADKAYRSGDFQRTDELTSIVLEENPRDHVALYLRGSARVEIGLRQRDPKLIRSGIADARESVRIERNEPKYYLPYLYGMTSLATVEKRKDHAEVAVKIGGQALELPNLQNIDRVNLLYQRGNAHKYLGDTEAALKDFGEAVQLDRKHLGAAVAYSDTLSRAGKYEEALKAFNSTVREFPRNPLSYNDRGMFLQSRSRYAEAIADFTRAIELNPQYLYSYTNRGAAYLESGNPKAAIADFNQSLKINPSQPAVLTMRSGAWLALGDLQSASGDQQNVLALVPKFGAAHADLGFVQFFAENYDGAVESFSKALEFDPSLRQVYPWQYWALKLSNQPDKAADALKAGERPENAEPEWGDQVVDYLQGEKTADELLAAVSGPDDKATAAATCEAHFFIGLQNASNGDQSEAEKHFQLALDTKASNLSAYRGSQFALKRKTAADDGSSAR